VLSTVFLATQLENNKLAMSTDALDMNRLVTLAQLAAMCSIPNRAGEFHYTDRQTICSFRLATCKMLAMAL
jgi:hypothetical protein